MRKSAPYIGVVSKDETPSAGSLLAQLRWSKATLAERLEQGRLMVAGRLKKQGKARKAKKAKG